MVSLRGFRLVLNRLFRPAEPARQDADPFADVEALVTAGEDDQRCRAVLRQLSGRLPGDVRGLVVRGNDDDGYAFLAQWGYSPALLELKPKNGPWRDPGPRIVSNFIAELFTANSAEMRTRLGEYGLREAQSAVVAPLDTNHPGALVLLRHSPEPWSPVEIKEAARWSRLLGAELATQEELRRTRASLVEFTRAFVQAYEAQEFALLGHSERVTSYALALGRQLELTRPELADVYFAAMLHDVGRMGTVIDPKDPLKEDTDHPLRGANLVASAPLLEAAREGIRTHHERWDGSGFPQGLFGESIPLIGRIVAVADAFDGLSSERGLALPLREVEKALSARARVDFDPKLVDVFLGILRRGKSTQELGRLDRFDLPI